MMVKSISQLSRGRYNLKKKKVWIKLNEDDEDIEYEAEVIDISDYEIHFYNNKGKIFLCKSEKHQLNIFV